MRGDDVKTRTTRNIHALLMIGAMVCMSRPAAGQEDFYHPELSWNTIETEHFYVHYHDGAKRTGETIAKIAEEIYGPVTSLYEHEPDQKVSFIVKDVDDISNGAAYFYDNKIEIYAPSMDFDLRGTHNWLRNVVTHEFTHIVQIQTSMKFGRTLPAVYLQWLGYESERRPDVLYGYPDAIVSYPISGFVVPVWFAEGVAQFNRRELEYDFWDSHRDMILRSYALAGNMLTWKQMAVFGKTSLGNESAYNAGFAFVSYIAQKYGEHVLNTISRNLATIPELTIDGAIERAVGKSGEEVYNEWKAEITRDYTTRVAPIRAQLQEGIALVPKSPDDSNAGGEAPGGEKVLLHPFRPERARMGPCCTFNATTGFANLYPAYSPDGTRLAYTSTKEADYFSQSSLYMYEFATGREKLVQPGVHSAVSWSPDGAKLFYARATRDNPHWSYQFDLYVYDLVKEKETRVTFGRRAISPAVSPDGSTIAFVVNSDGTSNLAVSRTDGSGFRVLTPYIQGEQVYNPKWSPDGDRIVFDYSFKDGRDIAQVRSDGTNLHFLITGDDDARSAVFTRDGSRIIFSSDRTGIFNVYSYTLADGSVNQITNVLGGAFMPSVDQAGDIAYAAYTSEGYKVYTLKQPAVVPEGIHHYLPATTVALAGYGSSIASTAEDGDHGGFDWQSLRSYDDRSVPEYATRPYKSIFTSLTVVPFVRLDGYNTKSSALENIKPGVYLFANDLLDRTGLFAGIALNKRFERDLFLQFNYRGKIPGFYQLGLEPTASAEIYNVTRKSADQAPVALGLDTIGVDVSYNLLEFDFVLNQPFVSEFSNVEFRYIHSRYTSIIESFVLPATLQLVPGSSDLYLIGNDLSLTLSIDAVVPSRTSEINPTGRKVKLRIGQEFNKFNGDGEYEVSSSGLTPVYKNVDFTRVELQWKEHVPLFLKNHTLTATLHGASILGPRVDEFFDYYAGGLIGMKGYPFYAIGGNELTVLGLNYRFPLIENIDMRLLHIYFDKLYASVFTDIGNAWTGDIPTLRQFKTDAGFEIRLESFSWYSYPTRIFFSGAYGFDKFDRYIRSRDATVHYGGEWRFYFGILFGFDFD
jgi:WD40 repeat protein